MKAITLLAISILSTAMAAQAQTLEAVRVGIEDVSGKVSYTLPQTTLDVTITVTREAVRKGPYARFSQKYLGVIAPLSDRETYSIKEASIALASPSVTPKEQTTKVTAANYVYNDTAFVRVLPDKMQVMDKSPEEMASSAATTIYMLRKRRIELITGDIGENVYGAGLKAALQTIDRTEQEYMALFLGKVTTTTYTETIRITPEGTKPSVMVARFTDSEGIVGENNLSGRPLVLEIRADKRNVPQAVIPKNAKNIFTYRMPEVVVCRLVDAGREVASARLPMLQYGSDLQIAR